MKAIATIDGYKKSALQTHLEKKLADFHASVVSTSIDLTSQKLVSYGYSNGGNLITYSRQFSNNFVGAKPIFSLDVQDINEDLCHEVVDFLGKGSEISMAFYRGGTISSSFTAEEEGGFRRFFDYIGECTGSPAVLLSDFFQGDQSKDKARKSMTYGLVVDDMIKKGGLSRNKVIDMLVPYFFSKD